MSTRRDQHKAQKEMWLVSGLQDHRYLSANKDAKMPVDGPLKKQNSGKTRRYVWNQRHAGLTGSICQPVTEFTYNWKPPARTTVKALKMTEATPPVVLARALFVPTVQRHKQQSNVRFRGPQLSSPSQRSSRQGVPYTLGISKRAVKIDEVLGAPRQRGSDCITNPCHLAFPIARRK